MIELFCKKTNCEFGSVLKIGSGEAILKTPFKIFVTRKVKKLANSILSKNYKTLHITMPLTPKLFIKASTKYWIEYGNRNGYHKRTNGYNEYRGWQYLSLTAISKGALIEFNVVSLMKLRSMFLLY